MVHACYKLFYMIFQSGDVMLILKQNKTNSHFDSSCLFAKVLQNFFNILTSIYQYCQSKCNVPKQRNNILKRFQHKNCTVLVTCKFEKYDWIISRDLKRPITTPKTTQHWCNATNSKPL